MLKCRTYLSAPRQPAPKPVSPSLAALSISRFSNRILFNEPPVLCVFNLQIPHTAQHIFAHVCEYQSPAPQLLWLVSNVR